MNHLPLNPTHHTSLPPSVRLHEIQNKVHLLLEGMEGLDVENWGKPVQTLQELTRQYVERSTQTGEIYRELLKNVDFQRDEALEILSQKEPRFARAYQEIQKLPLSEVEKKRLSDSIEPLLIETMEYKPSQSTIFETSTDLRNHIKKGIWTTFKTLFKKDCFVKTDSVQFTRIAFENFQPSEIRSIIGSINHVRELHFFNCSIDYFKDQELALLGMLPNVRHITFSCATLVRLYKEGRYHLITPLLQRLKSVALSDSLDAFQEDEIKDFFQPLSNIRSLYYSPFSLKDLSVERMRIVFQCFPQIQLIGMIEARIEELNEEQVEVLHEFFCQARYLNLSHNFFNEMPKDLFEKLFTDLPHLQEIILSYSQLTDEDRKRVRSLAHPNKHES